MDLTNNWKWIIIIVGIYALGMIECAVVSRNRTRPVIQSQPHQTTAAPEEVKTGVCSRNPCFNKGVCIQIGKEPGYKCRCSLTGYHGDHCQFTCPVPGQVRNRKQANFPYECVII